MIIKSDLFDILELTGFPAVKIQFYQGKRSELGIIDLTFLGKSAFDHERLDTEFLRKDFYNKAVIRIFCPVKHNSLRTYYHKIS